MLPSGPVVIRESSLAESREPLLGKEVAMQAGFASVKRRREFAAGRRCARAALEALGIRDFPLLPDKDRAPIWPEGIVGSITHTEVEPEGYCGVAVAKADDFQGLGIDAEPRDRLAPDLWPRVLDESEQDAARRAPEPGVYARLVFSAKEAVFKAVYPRLRRFLEFSDVHVACRLEDGTLCATLGHLDAAPTAAGTRILGRFVMDDALIVVGIALTAVTLQLPEEELSPQHTPC